jgi:hypothetical protein
MGVSFIGGGTLYINKSTIYFNNGKHAVLRGKAQKPGQDRKIFFT